jgi:hypothetical protein
MGKELSTASARPTPPVKWNRSEVSRHLLPILKYCDLATDPSTEQELATARQTALAAIRSAPTAYRELLRVYRRASDAELSRWFGAIDCEDALLEDVFIFIEDTLDPKPTDASQTSKASNNAAAPSTYTLESTFRALCRISDDGQAVNLLSPFEEYYFCDESRYEDCEYRRVLVADKCRALLQRYLNHYLRILDWYRANIPDARDIAAPSTDPTLRPESHVYLRLMEQWIAHCDYASRIEEQIGQLEYERGGLGWFHRQRKAEIDHTLAALRVQQCKLRLDDVTERYDAFCAPLLQKKEAMQLELDRAPLTAFARKKELRAAIAALVARMDEFHEQSGMDEIEKELAQLQKAARS